MTHRERILTALSHGQPDRLPVDLGSTIATTLTLGAHDRLRAHLGMPAGAPPPFFSRRSSTVIPDDAVLERFDADARPLLLGGPDAFPERELDGNALFDEWGVTWSKPEGGHYINTDGPFHRLEEPAAARVVPPHGTSYALDGVSVGASDPRSRPKCSFTPPRGDHA